MSDPLTLLGPDLYRKTQIDFKYFLCVGVAKLDLAQSAEDKSKLGAKDKGHPCYWEPRATTQIM